MTGRPTTEVGAVSRNSVFVPLFLFPFVPQDTLMGVTLRLIERYPGLIFLFQHGDNVASESLPDRFICGAFYEDMTSRWFPLDILCKAGSRILLIGFRNYDRRSGRIPPS